MGNVSLNKIPTSQINFSFSSHEHVNTCIENYKMDLTLSLGENKKHLIGHCLTWNTR